MKNKFNKITNFIGKWIFYIVTGYIVVWAWTSYGIGYGYMFFAGFTTCLIAGSQILGRYFNIELKQPYSWECKRAGCGFHASSSDSTTIAIVSERHENSHMYEMGD